MPADSAIIAGGDNSSLVRYSTTMMATAKDYTLNFGKLQRGQNFQLRCLLANTLITPETSGATWTNFPKTGATMGETVNIATLASDSTECLQYSFDTEQDALFYQDIQYYAQQMASTGGFNTKGCAVIVDSKNNKVTGYETSERKACKNSTVIGEPAEEVSIAADSGSVT